MRRTSKQPRRPVASPFAIWADYAHRIAERQGGASVHVIPTPDAPPRPKVKRKPRPKS
jgi:hypothetical protein